MAAAVKRDQRPARAHPPRHVGDQRHALRRRDAGAADRVHGDRAAAHGRRAGRSAQDASAQALGQDREPLSVTVAAQRAASICRTRRSPRTIWCRKLTAIAANGYDQRIFVRGDKRRRLRPRHGSDGPLSAPRASPISGSSPMSQSQSLRGIGSRRPRSPAIARSPFGLIGALMLHAGVIAATLFTWPHTLDIADESPPVVPVDLVTHRRQDRTSRRRCAKEPRPSSRRSKPIAAPPVDHRAADIAPPQAEAAPCPNRAVATAHQAQASRRTSMPRHQAQAAGAAKPRRNSTINSIAALLNKLTAPAARPRNAKVGDRTIKGVGARIGDDDGSGGFAAQPDFAHAGVRRSARRPPPIWWSISICSSIPTVRSHSRHN